MFQPGSGNEAFKAGIRPVPINATFTLTTPWSGSTLLDQRGSALTDFLERHFETTKLLYAQLRERSLHLPGMLSKSRNNEILAAWGEGNDPNASVFGALGPADQALRDEAIDRDTDRAWGQINDWAYRIDGQRPFMQEEALA
jgi:hypothetical protein